MRSVLAVSVSVIALVATGCGTSSEEVAAFDAERSDFTPETVRDFSGFPLYSLGTQFEDLPLTAIVRDDMLELYSGRVTIVVFGDTAALRARAAKSLASANALAGSVSAGEPLPPRAAGAMEGELRC